MMSESILYLLSWGACSWMTGIILVMQFIHYPNFKNINEKKFQQFARQHSAIITFIVFPPMLLELACAILLLYFFQSLFSWLNCFGVVLLWLITGLKSAPIHDQLAKKFDHELLIELLEWNRWRVFLWSTRFILLSWICFLR